MILLEIRKKRMYEAARRGIFGPPRIACCAVASRIKETLHSCHDSLIEFPHYHCIAGAPLRRKRYISHRELYSLNLSGRENCSLCFIYFILRHSSSLLRRAAEHFSAYSRVLLFCFFLFQHHSLRFPHCRNWKPLPGDGPQGSGVVLPAITATNRGGRVNTQRFNNP